MSPGMLWALAFFFYRFNFFKAFISFKSISQLTDMISENHVQVQTKVHGSRYRGLSTSYFETLEIMPHFSSLKNVFRWAEPSWRRRPVKTHLPYEVNFGFRRKMEKVSQEISRLVQWIFKILLFIFHKKRSVCLFSKMRHLKYPFTI